MCFDELHEVWMFVLFLIAVWDQCLFVFFWLFGYTCAELDDVFRFKVHGIAGKQLIIRTEVCSDHHIKRSDICQD